MRMTKKPMMAKRATKAAPAKKTMAAKKKTMAAKKPMTVAGKTVKKYQVGGPAMGTMPKGMAGTLGSPRAKPTTTVTPVKTPPKTVGMQRPTGAQPPKFTNYGPGSGQFQKPKPYPMNAQYDPSYQYDPQTSGRSDPRAIAARQEQERQRIMQEQMMQGGAQVIGQRPPMPPKQGLIANNGGALGAQSTDYAQASQLLSRMDPRSPFYNAIQQRVQQMGGMQSNNGAGMIANNPGALTGGMNQNDRARQQLMQQGMTPQQIQAQEAAIRQEMLRRGMPLGQGVGLPAGQGINYPGQVVRQSPEVEAQKAALMQQLQQQMAQNARGLGMGLPGGSQQQMGVQGQPVGPPAPGEDVGPRLRRGSMSLQEAQARHDAYRQQLMQQGMDPQRIQAEMARTTGVLGTLAPRQFRKGGAVAKKKKPAATTRGRMAKPARKR